MVKILYGVCGEGMGHASRSRILINYFIKQNHEVKIIAGGKAYDLLSKEFSDTVKSTWPNVLYKDNKVKIVRTLLRFSYITIAKSIPDFFKMRKLIKKYKPDIIITDAEPISFNAAFFSKIKRVSIDNQQALFYRKYKVRFKEIPAWIFLCFVLKVLLYSPDKHLIYDFSDEQIKNEKVLFLKPLIQEGILNQEIKTGKHVFVYQTTISNQYLFELLKKIDEKFIVYGMNKNGIDQNLTYKKFNEKEFYKDISTAKAIITNAGFTVLSEALYLKKPVFVLAVRHQFEQILNGKFIQSIGAGVSYLHFDEKNIKDFLKNLEKYKKNLKNYKSGNQKETLKKIEKEILSLI